MDLKVFHDFVRLLVQKERGGFITPEEIDDYADRAQWWMYNTEFDFYSKNQELKDSLSPFTVKPQFTTTNGLVTLPTDPLVNPCYEHLLSIYVQYYDNIHQRIRYKPVKFLSEDEIAERLDSQILEPTVTDPVGEQMAPGLFQLYPKTNLAGYSYYLRKPVKPVFAYTQADRDPVYDLANSVQLEWNENSINKILIKTIQFAGVNLNDEGVVQYTELKNQQDI